MAESRIASEQIIPAGKPWSAVIKRGRRLRIIDVEGEQGVDFLCYSAANPEERHHAANTLKKSQTLLLTEGHTLYSDVAQPLMTNVADTCGVHDTWRYFGSFIATIGTAECDSYFVNEGNASAKA